MRFPTLEVNLNFTVMSMINLFVPSAGFCAVVSSLNLFLF